MTDEPRAELFSHDADTGVRGMGPTIESAFEQAAIALTSCMTDPGDVRAEIEIDIECEAPGVNLLLYDWLNRLIYEMALRRMIFGRFAVAIEGGKLHGRAWGETIDPERHAPSVEPKGATLTALKVERQAGGAWIAQCVIDV